MTLRFLALSASALIVAACAHTPVSYEETSLAAARAADNVATPGTQEGWDAGNRAYLAWNGARRGWTTTESGLQYRRVGKAHPGAPQPTATDMVKVHYRGTFIDGQEFDSSYSRNQATAFPSDGVISGWVEALSMMRPGDNWRLAIPSDLAYGPSGFGPIPPDTVLLFDVELVKLLDAPWTSNGDCAA